MAVAKKTVKVKLKVAAAIVVIIIIFLPALAFFSYEMFRTGDGRVIAGFAIFFALTILLVKYAQEMLRYGNFDFRMTGNETLDSMIVWGIIVLLLGGLIIGNLAS